MVKKEGEGKWPDVVTCSGTMESPECLEYVPLSCSDEKPMTVLSTITSATPVVTTSVDASHPHQEKSPVIIWPDGGTSTITENQSAKRENVNTSDRSELAGLPSCDQVRDSISELKEIALFLKDIKTALESIAKDSRDRWNIEGTRMRMENR